jgi:hypothetical protein
MSLLFSRDDDSIKLASVVFGPQKRPQRRQNDSDSDTSSDTDSETARPSHTRTEKSHPRVPDELAWDCYTYATAHLEDYQIFRPHIAYAQKKMRDWKATKVRELIIPGYFDRAAWFTTIFGVIIGIFGALSLVTSIISIVLAIGAWKHPVAAPV